MARGIYEIKLKDRYFPAIGVQDAFDTLTARTSTEMNMEEVEVQLICKEEHTIKLFLLAKSMTDCERFEYNEVEAAVCALARELGYYDTYAQVANCVIDWVERLDELSPVEFEEWLID